jgi:IS5 family transposase
MRQTKKRNQWYFGMKAHLGIDSKSKLIHSAIVTAASVNDSTILPDILHGAETRVWSEAAYAGQTAAIRRCAPTAKDSTHEKTTRSHSLTDKQKASNATESKVRTRGEHPFLVIKRIFGFVKTRYRGLMKNANRLFVACALVNLFMMRRAQFAAREGGVRPPFAETPKQDGSGAEKQGPNGLLGLASCLKSTWRVKSGLIRASLISIAAKTSSFLAVV